MFFRGVSSVFPEILDKALRILEERAMRPGRGQHLFWFISAAYSLVQSKITPEHSDVCKLQATERVAKLYYKMLAFREDTSRPFRTSATGYGGSGSGSTIPSMTESPAVSQCYCSLYSLEPGMPNHGPTVCSVLVVVKVLLTA